MSSFVIVSTLSKINAVKDLAIWNIGVIANALLYFGSTSQFRLPFSCSLTSTLPKIWYLESLLHTVGRDTNPP